jgi:flagellar basal-body rod protein FlgG
MFDQMMIQANEQSTKAYQMLDAVSRNIANLNTPGYKAERFDSYLKPDGNTQTVTRTDFSQGQLMMTRRDLDVGVEGPGFIPVTRPDGSSAYTRSGSFTKNAQGYLVTPFGDLVGKGIQLPSAYHELHIEKDGVIHLVEKKGQEPKEIGRLSLVTFPNPEGLKKLSDNLLAETKDSGTPEKQTENVMIKQGFIETSNTNIHVSVEDMLKLNTAFTANLRITKLVDDLYRDGVNLKQ